MKSVPPRGSGWVSLQHFAALPPPLRKGSAFPISEAEILRLCRRRSLKELKQANGKPEAFRKVSGKAAIPFSHSLYREVALTS